MIAAYSCLRLWLPLTPPRLVTCSKTHAEVRGVVADHHRVLVAHGARTPKLRHSTTHYDQPDLYELRRLPIGNADVLMYVDVLDSSQLWPRR